MLRFALVAVVAMVPVAASGDYLYSVERNTGPKPYVLFLADNSGSMANMDTNSNCCSESNVKKCPKNQPICDTRITLLKSTLTDLIPKMDGISLGLVKYGVKVGLDSCGLQITNPLPTSEGAQPASPSELLSAVAGMKADSNTPIAQSLEAALDHLKKVREADEGMVCRKYVVIMLTDGEPNCARAGKTAQNAAYDAVDALTAEGIATYVIGFGADVSRSTFLTNLARRGGTARVGDKWCEPVNGTCTSGTALVATQRDELSRVLQDTFEQIQIGQFSPMGPIISTVAQKPSEIDRVSRNFLAYSAFEQPGYKGHLYGVKLFEETEKTGVWAFTDLDDLDLANCGSEGNPCLFDAGKILAARTKPRTIFSATPTSVVESDEGGLTLKFESRLPIETSSSGGVVRIETLVGDVLENSSLAKGIEALSEDDRDLLDAAVEDSDMGRALRSTVADWLHGGARGWPLADMYHSSPSIAGAPPYQYRTRGYPVFKAALRRRPDMIYVGANDGMIHAFHASPDLFRPVDEEPRWQPGEEAWSFLPYSMVVRTSLAALALPAEKRFFSQDLSCRIEDVLTKDNVEEGVLQCGDDPYCGWRTVLTCGQGWGGSWYVALDVTDPFDPKPLWEATHDVILPEEGDPESYGLGRTWGVPSVAVINVDRGEAGPLPTWLSVYGSGQNSDMRDADGNTSASYRLLNLPFAGAHPQHGDGSRDEKAHVFVQDMATGEFVKVFHHHDLGAVLADLPVVDMDHDSFSDAVYVGGWNEGRLDRISFASQGGISSVDDWSNACTNILSFGEDSPITSRPTAYADPSNSNHLYLFVGTGIDKGAGPDDQQDHKNTFDFRAFHLLDDGSAQCPRDPLKPDEDVKIESAGNMCNDTSEVDGKLGWTFSGVFDDGQRLLSAPVLVTQRDGTQQLTFTSWKPTASACGEGVSALYCIDVTQVGRCLPCGSLGGDGSDSTSIDLGGAKPTTPTSADGQLYTVGGAGLVRVGNQDGKGKGPDGKSDQANVNAPRSVILSWRDVF